MAPEGDPKDMADLLEALARRIRSDPSFGHPTATGRQPVSITPSANPAEDEPSMGPLDVFTDDRNVTVTTETRNADASAVHVSILSGRLLIGLGDGPHALKRDVALPAAVDEDAAVATFRNGILDVVLPLRRM